MVFLEICKPFCKERYFLNNREKEAPDGNRLSFYACYESEYDPRFRYKREGTGRFYNIFYVFSGVYELVTKEGKVFSFPEGSFVIDNMEDSFCHIGNGGNTLCSRKCLLLHKTEFARRFISLFFPEGKILLPIREKEKILEYFEKIRKYFTPDADELDISAVTGLLAELFDFLNSRREKKAPGGLLSRILAYMESRLFDPGLQREEISSHVGVSPSTLDRFFRKHMGKSVNHYIAEKRLEQAARLLELPLLRSKEIAASSGFSSVIYMDRLFRKKYGVTPTQYRKQFFSTTSPDP